MHSIYLAEYRSNKIEVFIKTENQNTFYILLINQEPAARTYNFFESAILDSIEIIESKTNRMAKDAA